METSLFPLGLDAPDPMNLNAANNENDSDERLLHGYSLDYRIRQDGPVSVTRIFRITKWQGNQAAEFKYDGVRYGIGSDIIWNIIIVNPGEGIEAPVIQMINGNEEKGFVLCARLLHADVLPGLAIDDSLQIRPFCKVAAISVPDNGEQKDPDALASLLLPAELVDKERNEESGMQVFINGEIISADYDSGFASSDNLALIKVKTPIGPLPMELDLALLGEDFKALFKKGNIIRATGWLFGDVAVGQYASGMVLDLEHNLRALGFCAKEYDFSRTRQIFSDNCQYFARDELRATGPEAIIAALNGIARLTIEKKYKPDFVYGQIFLKNKSETFKQNQKCLVFLDADGHLYFLMCAKVDDTGRISKLYTAYDTDDIEAIATTADFAKWCEGLSNTSAPDEENEAGNKEGDYYSKPEFARQLHGEADAFFGEPFFGFGDVLDIMIPGENDETFAKVGQLLAEAKLAGEYKLESFTGLYLDYPEKDAELGLQFALGKEPAQKSFQVEYVYPVMQGCRQSLKIMAAFDWPEKVCAYIAAAWRGKTALNFFAPSYRLWNNKIIFGQHLSLALSGIALSIEAVPHPKFSVDKGQFYELNLARFLYENPDKTAADFEAPVVHTEGSVILIPREHTGLYELQAPVKKVENVKFDQNNFVRLLMPIARDWDEDEELLAWVYVSEKELGDPRPKPGDPLLCVIWLCACMADL